MSLPRVLMVTGAYYPEFAGGSLQCRTLMTALRGQIDFVVLTTTSTRRLPSYSHSDAVPVYRVYVDPRRAITKLMAGVRMAALLVRLMRKVDVVHAHGFTEKMLLILVAARLAGRPVIAKITSLAWDDPVAIRHRHLGRLLGAAQAKADRIVTMNPAMVKQCRLAGIEDARIVTIPNGVDTARFAPVGNQARALIRRQLNIPANVCLVTFIGFWSVEKGPGVLFESWDIARKRARVDTALLFIGSTDSRHPEVDTRLVSAVRRRVTEMGISDRVIFVEKTEDVATYLAASDIFALPSAREGLSNALLEAMATGLACVCGEIPEATDVVVESGVNGWQVRAGDVDGLAAVLAMLMKEEQLRMRLGKAARDTVLAKFAIQTVASRYLELYTRVMRTSRAPAVRRD